MRIAGLETFFDGVFFSEHLGAEKPNKQFFDLCFAKIPDFCADESIIVGDSLTSDIRGGMNAGIKTCWFNPRGKAPIAGIVPDYEIAQLSMLPDLLKSL